MKDKSVSYHPAKTACRLMTAFLKYPRVNTYTILTNGEPTAEIVRPLVQPKSYDTSCHTILLIFGQKLEGDKLRKLIEPDFRKKFWFIQ